MLKITEKITTIYCFLYFYYDMESLFTLQYTCLLVFAMLMLQLLVSRLYQNSTTPQYEKSRLLLAATMLILVVHYALQIKFKLRANDDNVGTVFNTLFYPIANYFLACSIIQLQSSRKTTRRYAIVGALACLSIVGVFAIGWYTSGNMALDGMRGILFSMFALSMVYFMTSPTIILRRTQHRINNDTGGDISTYDRYTKASYLLLSMLSSTLIFAVTWRPALYVVGPLMLFTMFLFVSSFVALGFNMAPVEDVLTEDETYGNASDYYNELADDDPTTISTGQIERISNILEQWVANGGFRDSSANIGKLSQQTGISRIRLSQYFDQYLNSTFRVWLSGIRFAEAQRLVKAHPEYNNDTISVYCGFSSRSQLYKIFNDNTGMSPREWREMQG